MRFVNISIGTKDSFLLNRTASEVGAEFPDFRYVNYDSADLDSDPELLLQACDEVSGAQFVTMKVHGDTSYMKRFDRLRKVIESNRVSALLV